MTSAEPLDIALPPHSFGLDTYYRNVLDVRFVSQALSMSARCIRGAQWPTTALFPQDAPDTLATAYYAYNRSFEALVMVEGVLAHVIRQGDTATVRLAASDRDALARAEANLRQRMPEPEGNTARNVAIEFSHWAPRVGIAINSRMVAVPTLDDIRTNYESEVSKRLGWLASDYDPERNGRLLLWHGAPGCGKTWALRALASEWREWCTLKYVTDPETFLNTPAYLTELLHRRSSRRGQGDSWSLIVLEDTGELLSTDAKQKAGQGLSRLLNVADGLLGESSKALFLVTTNEDLRSIHPAIARPGRCGQLLEFGPLSSGEANTWLEAHGSEETVGTPATLAELFAVRDGTDLRPARRRSPGFI